jgi:HEAT repeat protein
VHGGNEAIELGTVPLAPDGSFFVEVPADMPIAFQIVDAEGRSEMNQMSWIYVRPGERKSCVGCHNTRSTTPVMRRTLALMAAPVKTLEQGKPFRFRGQNAWMGGMMDIQFERLRETASLDQHCLEGGSDMTGQQELVLLISWLKSPDSALRISACQRLSVYHHRAAAAEIVKLLTDSNREVRLAAIMGLAACGTRDSVEPLLNVLSDSDPVIAQASALAIENLTGYSRAFNAFEGRTRDKQAEQAKEWFKTRTWESIERDLIREIEAISSKHKTRAGLQMSDENRIRQRRAIVALGHIGGDKAAFAVQAYVGSQTNMPQVLPKTLFGRYFRADSPCNPRTQQEGIRVLGHLQNSETTALMKGIVENNLHHRQSNLFLSEICLEAMGYANSNEHEDYMIDLFGRLKEFWEYYNWYGPGTPNNEVSPLHYRVLKYLDKIGSTNAIEIVPAIIRSLPIDPDRQLFMDMDDYETVAGRVIRRAGAESKVVEMCLEIMGEPSKGTDEKIKKAVSKLYVAFGGNPGPKNRAAQVLSIICRSKEYEPRIRAAFNRYRDLPRDPLIRNVPFKNHKTPVSEVAWVRYYLARLLGELRDPASSDSLIEALEKDPNEAAWGRPSPNSLYVVMLQNEHTPCYRAAAARALGSIREKRSTRTLLKVLSDLDNAIDTRYAAAVALKKIKDKAIVETIDKIAADYPDVSVKKVLLSIKQER